MEPPYIEPSNGARKPLESGLDQHVAKNFVSFDAAFADVIDCAAEIETLGTGFGFTEGPVWDRKNARLIFSDMKQDHMRSWSARDGVQTFRRPSNKANGNAIDPTGRLLSCEHVTSRVVRENGTGGLDVIASHYRGKQLNSPNDIITGADGTAYFSDPTYGRIREELGLLREPELDFRGVYRVSPAGEISLLADDFEQPNGLCLSPDGEKLYVNDTIRLHIRQFTILPNGGVTGGGVWAQMQASEPGAPDGMKVDRDGRVFCTGPGGIHVLDHDARCLGVVRLPELPANFAWGEDGYSVFVTARTSLYRFRTKIAGAAV